MLTDEQLQNYIKWHNETIETVPLIPMDQAADMALELLMLRTPEQVFVCQAPGSPGPIFAFKGRLSDVKPTWKILDQTRDL